MVLTWGTGLTPQWSVDSFHSRHLPAVCPRVNHLLCLRECRSRSVIPYHERGLEKTMSDNSLNCTSSRDSNMCPPPSVIQVCLSMWRTLWGVTLIPLSGLRPSFFQLLGVLAGEDSQLSPSPGTGLSQNSHFTQGHATCLQVTCIQL